MAISFPLWEQRIYEFCGWFNFFYLHVFASHFVRHLVAPWDAGSSCWEEVLLGRIQGFILGPVARNQLSNFKPLVLKRWTFSMFLMKEKPRGLRGLMAKNPVLRNDIKEIVAPEIDPKRFGTSEKRTPGALTGSRSGTMFESTAPLE